MGDIVEKLRLLAAIDNCQASLEAADEIERLREALEPFACACEDQCLNDAEQGSTYPAKPNAANCSHYAARAALAQGDEK